MLYHNFPQEFHSVCPNLTAAQVTNKQTNTAADIFPPVIRLIQLSQHLIETMMDSSTIGSSAPWSVRGSRRGDKIYKYIEIIKDANLQIEYFLMT